MKKLIIFILLIFTIHSTYSQNVLDGIFELRLGMTESELKKKVDATLLTEDKDLTLVSIREGLGDRVNAYNLKQYMVTSDYSIQDIALLFFDSVLYQISINSYNSRTESLLTQKYGEPEKAIERRKISNTNYTTMEREWKTNSQDISCMSYHAFREKEDDMFSYKLTIINHKTLNFLISEAYYNGGQEHQKKADQPLLDRL